MIVHPSRTLTLVALSLLALTGCAAGDTAPTAAAENAANGRLAKELRGDPASLILGVYAIYAGARTDCGDLQLVQDDGDVARDVDVVRGDPLLTATPPDGTYGCVALRMSDVVRMVPATTVGACEAGRKYTSDLYRRGSSGWVDVKGQLIHASGTDEEPSDDHVTLFLSRTPSEAVDRRISPTQILQLGSPLVVPGRTRLTWDGAGTVVSDGDACGIVPGRPSFE